MLSLTFLPFTSILCTWRVHGRQHGAPTGPVPHNVLTRKSTPMVAFDSSSGSHCSSEKRRRRLLLPTEELPIRRSLTFMGAFGLSCACDIVGVVSACVLVQSYSFRNKELRRGLGRGCGREWCGVVVAEVKQTGSSGVET